MTNDLMQVVQTLCDDIPLPGPVQLFGTWESQHEGSDPIRLAVQRQNQLELREDIPVVPEQRLAGSVGTVVWLNSLDKGDDIFGAFDLVYQMLCPEGLLIVVSTSVPNGVRGWRLEPAALDHLMRRFGNRSIWFRKQDYGYPLLVGLGTRLNRATTTLDLAVQHLELQLKRFGGIRCI